MLYSTPTTNRVSVYKNELKTKGLSYFFYARLKRRIINPISLLFYKYFKFPRNFKFNKQTYNYKFAKYNKTWENERAIELPIIYSMTKKYKNEEILEVGNVLSHYYKVDHDIVDKYEISNNVINIDILDFKPVKKYKFIIAISTLEHIGWDEDKRKPVKVVKAFNHLISLLKPEGYLVVTIPIKYNKYLDSYISKKIISFKKTYYFKRISKFNTWKQTDYSDVLKCKYNNPYPAASAVLIGITKRNA